ncbi:MAG: isoprenylcysteine carboxylmethyltransferase family protein [Thermodesulfovibrio sp.]|nr:isoprenylcysteine carboxylmethyltransferase family protein [Thermodesulfovibrio sp.]MDW7972417.1 isoprenylcysteine carboxylmethyltransferase family protein [Thermodesulfovibrio sp.]
METLYHKILEVLALITLIFGFNIPLFWIPVHLYPKFFRKLGILTYIMPFSTLSLIAFLVFEFREYILIYAVEIPSLLSLIGLVIFIFGVILHIWTAKLLSLWGLIGIPEIFPKISSKLIASGPFSKVRHPTYLAHTMIFLGVFLLTEFVAVGILTLFDFVMVHTFVIPFEERELLSRFGKIYEEYKNKVRWRILPGVL